MMAWYVPDSDLKYGQDPKDPEEEDVMIQTVHAKIHFINPGIQKIFRN